uniref:Uncharacterized protein n=1 Tax=Aegilops tauschii subsp. strangulata TaxID=200361 RepID=A0A452XD73_AEGTS
LSLPWRIGTARAARPPGHTDLDDPSTTLLRRVQAHLPTSTQVVGILTLLIAGAALLVLAGLTLTGAVVALVFLGPLAGAADQPGAVRVRAPRGGRRGALLRHPRRGYLGVPAPH